MRMKKIMILAVAAIAMAACTKNYDKVETPQQAIGFNTWNDVMTKAPKTAFVATDEFDVYGFKWNAGPANQTTVFDGDDVVFDGENWSYTTLRFWDSNFANYTFFAAYPKDQLATAPAQTGLFVSNSLVYDGSNEKLLIAQQKNVANANFGSPVHLVFKHTAALVDIKVKKHTEIAAAKVVINNIHIGNVKTTGTYTVASYDSENDYNPVGATVSGTAGLGWTSTAAVNADEAPYVKTTSTTLGYDVAAGTANAADLITNLIVMPQELGTSSGPTITINYSIVAGSLVDDDDNPETPMVDSDDETITFTPGAFYIGGFDITDPDPSDKANTGSKIPAWMPGVHYTYYITINAHAITFTAEVAGWDDYANNLHYYLIN